MAKSPNSIDTSIIAFNYDSKALALRCKSLIEAMLDAHILPEMDTAISNIIPDEFSIQLETLEIDIGTIDEKELLVKLPKLIKTALEEALHTVLRSEDGLIMNNSNGTSERANYLIATLEHYLTRGYFPSWIKGDVSVVQLISSLMASSQNALIEMIKKHSENKSSMKRLYTPEIIALDMLPNLSELRQTRTDEQLPRKDSPRNSIFIETQEIRIHNNSGLLLLWPFLTRFFEKSSLVKNDEFVDDESRNRAVYLLQYLVHNHINFQEYELVLNKLLVGLPLQYHLSPITALTQDEKDLAASLLNGFKSNWDKVKGSTIPAIQETFFKRHAVLKIKEKHMELVLERKGVDVLLQSISWDISIIAFPWMKKPIHIAWV